jgi:hypothetical protein
LNALNIGEGCVLSVAMAEYKQDSGVDMNINVIKSVVSQPSSGIQLQSVSNSSSSSGSGIDDDDDRLLRILLEQLDSSLSPIIEYAQMQR